MLQKTLSQTVLTQKRELGDEYPISFMRTGLQGDELNYPVVDKQAYVVFKAVKQFKPYILKNRTKVSFLIWLLGLSLYRRNWASEEEIG